MKDILDTLEINKIVFKIGMRLECIDPNGCTHGPMGHILEIASFDNEIKNTPIWCHGIYRVKTFGSTPEELIRKYPTGNYGISIPDISKFRIMQGDWDI